MIARRWIVRGHDTQRAASLARTLGVSPIIASLLIGRGCDNEQSARTFLQPTYSQLHDPLLMLGMSGTVSRLLRAIDQSEPILIYGDYDVDGTTGTAVLLRALRLLGARVGFLVTLGLRDLPGAKNPGLRALMEVAGCGDGSGMTAYDLGFRIGPRINAAGKMDAARAVVELFDTRDQTEARRLAEDLDIRNRERREVQQEIIERALAELEDSSNSTGESHVAVIAGIGWHRGVIGIAAAKIAERINRPCVVIS